MARTDPPILTRDTPLTSRQVAYALHWSEATARGWLRDQRLAFTAPGGSVRLYLWGEVLDRVRGVTAQQDFVPTPGFRRDSAR